MKDHWQRVENQNKEICMLTKVNTNLDLRRFNDAVKTDAAIIFSTVDGEPTFERNMISFSKVSGAIKNISVEKYVHTMIIEVFSLTKEPQ